MRHHHETAAPLAELELPDVHTEAPEIPLRLDEAGVADLRYPIVLELADGTSQPTVATVAFGASVAADRRALHMSRFVEALHAHRDRIGVQALPTLLADAADRLQAETVVVRFAFPLFLERSAPVSGGSAFVGYDCELDGVLERDVVRCTLVARVPVTSLCPCSRDVSDYGAHNQRGAVEMRVELDLSGAAEPVDFPDLIAVAEHAGSAPIRTLLKRADERSVTMQAYEHPAFVEDIVRAVATDLQREPSILGGQVWAANEESIHTHRAYARVQWSHSAS